MKKLLVVLLCLGLVGCASSASIRKDAPSQEFDYDFLRLAQGSSMMGLQWVKMTQKEKITYLMGYEDGNLNDLALNVKDQNIRKDALRKLPSFVGTNEDYKKELISKLDEYYGQGSAYKVFPIPLVIGLIINKELGVKDEVVHEQFKFYERELRSIVDKSDEKITNRVSGGL